MKITIDTKEDSANEIKKVIHLLNILVEGRPITSNASTLTNSETKNEYLELPNVGNFMEDNEKKDDDDKESSSVIMY